MFEKIHGRGVDDLLATIKAFHADSREHKVDLVLGVYKDEVGRIPIMKAVKLAEAMILQTEQTKNYVGVSGDPEYRALVPKILLGDNSPIIHNGRVATLQTPGGAGALKVAFDFLNKVSPSKRLWVSMPTWANHIPVAQDAGLNVAQYPYFRQADRSLDFGAMMSQLDESAATGDAILLHACCHNPTGVDLSYEQWQSVTKLILQRGLIPVLDCAYQGLGDGMQEDVAGLRHMADQVPEMLIASSFSKNFGIYRERTGALTVQVKTSADLAQTYSAIETVVRSIYSMPPSHGAKIVTTVLSDPELISMWRAELAGMRERVVALRSGLHSRLQTLLPNVDTSFLTSQRGMFSYTGLSPSAVNHLKQDFGIYSAGDGRINVAGLQESRLDEIADAFASAFSTDEL